jgi:hypothetical protein
MASVNMKTSSTERDNVMAKLGDMGQPHHPQERRHRRFNLRYPVQVKFNAAGSVSELQAFSNNLSLGGILLETAVPPPQPCQVSFTMTVKEHPILGSACLVGEGEVVRVEPRLSGAGFAVAIMCKRPISELEHFSPSAN